MSKIISHNLFIAFALFIFTLVAYRLSFPEPRLWYNHYIHLSYSLLHGRVDVPTLPDYYQDVTKINDKTFLPFGPLPALVLLPAVTIWGLDTSQPLVSAIIGAVNIGLIFLVLKRFGTKINVSLLLALFLGFGTVHWYASVVGTTWFFAHICGVFFTLLSLLFWQRSNFSSGLFLSLAALSRYPILLSALAFFDSKRLKKNIPFLAGISIFVIIQLLYNWLRFGDILDSGYNIVYSYYANPGDAAGFYRSPVFSFLPSFNLFDPRNIPLHLYTMFLMLPEKIHSFPYFAPSPYGMSIILTSPLLLYILKADFKSQIARFAIIATIPIALLDFMHYSQGWVQFGYRFSLDFQPLLILLLAVSIQKIKPLHLILFAWSVLVNFWGVWWGIKLGW